MEVCNVLKKAIGERKDVINREMSCEKKKYKSCCKRCSVKGCSVGILSLLLQWFVLSRAWTSHRPSFRSSSIPHFYRESTSVEASAFQKTRETRQKRFERMVVKLREYRRKHGHTLVLKNEDKELHRWAQSLRKNYVHPDRKGLSQINGDNTHHQLHTQAAPASSSSSRWDETSRNPVELACPRTLPKTKLRKLEKAGFIWDIQSELWDRKYKELEAFVKKEGHCFVPYGHPTLGVWVRNQRREYRNLELGESSTLSHDRLGKLHALSFPFSRPRMEQWESRYQELLEYYKENNNSDVPENWEENFSLGQWCRNQRAAFLRYQEGLPCGLTKEKVCLLEDVDFSWNLREKRWQEKLSRLQSYYQEHGHVMIHPADMENRDLRIWLTFQRYFYNQRKRMVKKGSSSKQQQQQQPMRVTPLTDERIAAIEEIVPDFAWKVRDSSGPSREDWADLFQAMRDKGIRPGMRPKQHWFEGESRSSITVKDVWTEQDLLELWNQEPDDDDEDDDL